MKIYRLSPLAVAVILAACGGSSSSPTVAPATSSGLAVDGYISGATVICDVNADGVADAGEATTTTDGTGAYSLVCSSPLLLTGGTNIDTDLPFKGLLRAPAGSTVITPLTNMVALGMTNAQVVAALGLPEGTDVTTVDPAEKTNGLLVNEALYQKTLALQQIIQQMAEVIYAAAKSGTASGDELRAQYAVIAQAVATELTSASSSAPLISTTGVVSSSLVTTLIEASVTAIQSTTDTTLAALKTAAASLDGTRMATFLQPSLTDQAGGLAVASQDALASLAKRNGSDTILAEVASSLRSNSAFEETSSVSLGSVATVAQAAVANGVISSSTTAALTAAGVTAELPTVTTVTNYFAIASDTITLGTSSPTDYTLSELSSGITLTGPTSSTDDLFNLSFDLTTVGTPITTVTTGLGFELAGSGDDMRVLRFIIDKVDLTLASGQVTATVPADATLSVYARKSDESEVTFALTNLAANMLSTSEGSVTFSASSVVTKILAQANDTQDSFFTNFLNSTGTFDLKAVLSSTVPIRKSGANLLAIKTVTVGSLATVAGPSVSGTVTVN